MEKTPDEYVSRLVTVFRAVRRILRPDGTLWLNLGDSYANDGKWGGTTGGKHVSALHGEPIGRMRRYTGLKPKELVGIPWHVAFALQEDGWYLRSDIVWNKTNPMPESVLDRPTRSHEYIFLFSKQQKYFYDSAAIAEPAINAGKVVRLGPSSFAKRQAVGAAVKPSGNGLKDTYTVVPTRNRRTVWTLSTQPFKGAHFAVFPEELVKPCILAGCPEGEIVLDPFCGSGRAGVVALKNKRYFIGIDVNPEYVQMAEGILASVQ
jgi:DNA modification methylase